MYDGLSSGVVLGGLGTGSIEIRGDGGIYEWHIFNNRPWGSGPETDEMDSDGLYFGIVIRFPDRSPRCFLLRKPTTPHPHLNDPYNLPWVERPRETRFEWRFPKAEFSYVFPEDIPVSITLEAYSPFIPLDAKNSSLPAANFLFNIVNTGNEPVDVSVFGVLKNGVMYDVPDVKSEMLFNGSAIVMSRETNKEHHSSFGSLALTTFPENCSCVFGPVKSRQIWEPLMETGDLAEIENPQTTGCPYGALARRMTIPSGKTEPILFILSWFFPNHYENVYKKAPHPENIGHHYENVFSDAEEVGAYLLKNYTYLKNETDAFLNTFYNSSMEQWLLDGVNAQLTTLPKSSWWDKKGRFGIWEGLGCCGLQTMDITHYGSFPVVLFFPNIQKSQMRLSASNIEAKGKIPHMMPGSFQCGDEDIKKRIDLMPQFVLLLWRDLLWTGDREYARELFPCAKDAIEYIRGKDTDGDGLPNNSGPDQTYDQFPIFGTSAFVGLLYIASLKAAGDIAEVLGEDDYALKCREEYPKLLKVLEKQVYNGKYYCLSYDTKSDTLNNGCMIDQINAEWFLRMAGDRGILDDEKVHSSLESILNINRSPYGFWNNCAWEDESDRMKVELHRTDQINTPWTGIEYMLSSFLILDGRIDDGVSVAKDVWDRYEKAGLRFNHIECGEHYYRAMSSWAVLLAMQGFGLDMMKSRICFTAREKEKAFLFNTPGAWGRTVIPSSSEGDFILEVMRGALDLKSICIENLKRKPTAVFENNQAAEYSFEYDDNTLTLCFEHPVILSMGSELKVEF